MDKTEFKKLWRRSGYFESGQVRELANGDVNTNSRGENRSGVSLFPSESASEGDQGFFLVGQGGSPAPCGYWPFIL